MRFARNVHRALLFANGPVEFSRAGEAFMCVRSSRTPLILCLCSTLTLALILGLPQPLLSQSQSQQGYLGDIGKPNFEAMSAIESGFINLNNGNLHLEFPIASVPQRGNLPFSAKLIYDSRIWNYNPTAQTSGWGALGGGWKLAMTGTQYTTFVSDFYVTDSIQHVNCGGTVTSTIISGFMLTAADGTQHSFPGQLVWDGPSGGCQSQVLSLTSYANDGSGYLFVGTKNNPITAIYDNIGTQVFPSYVDANGNLFTHNSNNDTVDSRGTVPVQTTVSGNVTPV